MNDTELIRSALAILMPVIVLVLVSAAVPIWLARRLGHDLRGRAANIALSSLVMLILSGVYFAVLYILEAPGIAGAIGAQPMVALGHFLWLGLMAGLIWAPVVVLSATIGPRDGAR